MATGLKVSGYECYFFTGSSISLPAKSFNRWTSSGAISSYYYNWGYNVGTLISGYPYVVYSGSFYNSARSGTQTATSAVYLAATHEGSDKGATALESFSYYNLSVASSTGGSCSITCSKVKSTSSSIVYGRFSSTSLTSTSGSKYVLSGATLSSASATADATAGYYFSHWLINGTTYSTFPSSYTITEDTTIQAVFVRKPYLTVTAGSGGSVTTNPTGYITPNTTAHAVAEADDGYRFVGWFKNGASVASYVTAEADLEVEDVNVAYEAQFVTKYHTVTVDLSSSSTAGSATVKMYVGGEEVSSGSSIIEGTEVNVVCTPKIDYNFTQWLIDGSNAYTASYSFIVASSHSSTIACLAVVIEKNSYNIAVTKVDPTRGTVALADSEKSWSETNDAISAIGHSGVQYTVSAAVVSSLSATGRELNKFSGFTKNGSALVYTEVTAGSQYQATFTNGNNLTSETLDDIAIVATFAQKTLYHAEINIPYSERGTALITPDPDVSSPTAKWLEGTITAVATPVTGMKVSSFNVQDLDAGGNGFVVENPVADADGKYRCSFTLSFNAKIIVNFQAIPCTVGVGIHSASLGKGTATVASTAQGGGMENMKYGDIAIFTATPYTTPSPGYQFSGWYDANGNTVPDSTIITQGVSHTYHYYDAEYRVSLTGDLTLYARFKAQVTIGLSSTASASGSITLDDQTSSSASISKWVELGQTCSVAATPASGGTSFFGAWYLSTDTEFTDPLDVAASETLTVTDTISYVARFVSSADALYVAMCNYDNDTNLPDATLGLLLMRTSGSTPTEVTTCTEAEFLAATGLATAPAGATKYYTLVGTSRVSIVASPAVGRGFNKWTRLAIVDGEVDTEVQLGLTAVYSTVVNRHFIYRAYWGDPKPAEIKLNYCTGSNVTMGNLNIEGVEVADSSIENKSQTGTETKATYTQNDIVKMFVDIKNGYLFDGWYYDAEHTNPLRDSTVDGVTYSYTDAEYRFTVSSPVTICAKFKEDANALYKWEGSSTNKMMTWKSKIYVATKPFDPTVARVDATGYTVAVGGALTLTVEMYSSPDSTPTSTRQISLYDQDMRRLPVRRPERYLQVQVENNSDVNAIFIGTSAMGLEL